MRRWTCPVCPPGPEATIWARGSAEDLEDHVERHELVVHGIGAPPVFETYPFVFLRERMPSDDWPKDSSGFPTLGAFLSAFDQEPVQALPTAATS